MRSFDELTGQWEARQAIPGDRGAVSLVVVRTGGGNHETPNALSLDPATGIAGDRWSAKDAPDPADQVTLMMVTAAEFVADGQPLHLPGDNVLVDLDLSENNLPAGSRIRLGTAVVEVSAKPHTGCAKFSQRFGPGALRWVNWKPTRSLRLRGVNCRIVEAGIVTLGDPAIVLGRSAAD